MTTHPRLRVGRWAVALALLAAGMLLPALVGRAAPAAATTGAPGFGHEVVLDHQRVAGEPSLSISPTTNASGHHDIYVSAPFGFSTSASFVWKSADGGQTFHLVGAESPPSGKPTTCAGGGDSSIVNDPAGNLYFADLQGLSNVSASVSTDTGKTFTTTCNSANWGVVDRPWLSTYKDPLTTGREYMTVDDVGACTVNCGLGQAGSNLLELTSAAGTQAAAQLFAPVPAQQIEPDGIVSGTVVNQSNGDLYIAHTALTDAKGHLTGGGDANGNSNGIVVDRFPGGYSSPVATPIPPGVISICKPYNATGPCRSDTVFHASLDQSGNSTVTTGQDFSPMAIDRAGDLYVTWSQAPVNSSGQIDGPSTIYLATSTDKGATWSAPIDVSGQLSGLKTNVFPWIAAGARGALDIVWYGTPQLGACPNQPCGSGAINGVWNVYLAQTLDAVTTSGTPNPTPAFTTTKVTEHPNHFGAICTMGIGCSTGGDRGLLDFLSVQVEPSGAADVVWADSANTDFFGESSSLIGFAHQVSGPGLYGGTVSGPTPALGSAAGSPDAYFAGNNAEAAAPAGSNVRIVSSSMSVLPVAGGGDNDNYYRIVMKLPPGSLASLSPPSMGTDTDANLIWLTRWETPNRKPSVADQGHFFYAAMESDGGGSPSFFDGETTCGLNEGTHCKYLAYPATHPLPTTGPFASGYNAATGKITLIVPVADVGGLQEAKLYSVTGLTATQAQPSCPAGSSTCSTIFNVIDSTAPYSATG